MSRQGAKMLTALLLFVAAVAAQAQRDTTGFWGDRKTQTFMSADFSLHYQTLDVLGLQAGFTFHHFLRCKEEQTEIDIIKVDVCGAWRYRHSYQFNYLPFQKAVGASVDVNYTYLLLIFNLHGANHWKLDGSGTRFMISPQSGLDLDYYSFMAGPSFMLHNDWDDQKWGINLQVKYYPLRKNL